MVMAVARKWWGTSVLAPVLVFTTMMLGSFVIGIIVNLPALFLISFFSLSVAVVSMLRDHWVLNSIVVPMSFIFGSVSVMDAWNLDVLLFIVHLPTFVIAVIVACRSNTSLIVMLASSAVYAAWVYSMMTWVALPFYGCVLWICAPFWQAIVVLIGCSVVSGAITAKNARLKGKGTRIDCAGGICPL